MKMRWGYLLLVVTLVGWSSSASAAPNDSVGRKSTAHSKLKKHPDDWVFFLDDYNYNYYYSTKKSKYKKYTVMEIKTTYKNTNEIFNYSYIASICSANPNKLAYFSDSPKISNSAETGEITENTALADWRDFACREYPVRVDQFPNNRSTANLTPNQQTCRQYGFKLGTQPFAQCLLQLDQMKQQAEYQQQQYQFQQQLYQQQQAAYEAQAQEVEKERQRRKWAALARLGFGMAASNSPTFIGGVNDGLASASGMPVSRPTPPSPPPIQNYTIRTASGNQVYCTYNTAAALVTCN